MAFNKGKEKAAELAAEEIAKNGGVSVDVLAAALKEALGGPTVRKVPFGQHSVKTPFNPSGKKNRPVKYMLYQNGYRVNPRNLTDEEIELINSGKIKTGFYLNNTVVLRLGNEGGDDVMHINYKNKTADQRMALGSQLTGPGKTGLARLLRMIAAERTQQEKSAKEQRRREIEEAMQPEAEDSDPLDVLNTDGDEG